MSQYSLYAMLLPDRTHRVWV